MPAEQSPQVKGAHERGHEEESEHDENHVPRWLQLILAGLIVTNIISYFVVTTYTMGKINQQIERLHVRKSSRHPDTSTTPWDSGLGLGAVGPMSNESILSAAEEYTIFGLEPHFLGHIHDDPENIEEHILMLEHRKHKILLGTVMEIFLDTVDLVNTFIHNFWLHIIYSVIKIGSIGAWTYAQADLNQPAIWFVPIGIAMFITLLLLEWFESSRKYFLALLIVVAAFSWVLILSIRCNQINESIDTWKDKAKDPRQNKTDCDHNVNTLHANMIQLIAGTTVMVLLGLYGLVAIWLANFWFALVFAVLFLLGDVWWIFLVHLDKQGLDHLFEVPLVYAMLIVGTSMLYLYDIYYTQTGQDGTSSFLKKVDSKARLKHATLKTHSILRYSSGRSLLAVGTKQSKMSLKMKMKPFK